MSEVLKINALYTAGKAHLIPEDAILEVLFRDWSTDKGPEHCFDFIQAGNIGDIIAFRITQMPPRKVYINIKEHGVSYPAFKTEGDARIAAKKKGVEHFTDIAAELEEVRK